MGSSEFFSEFCWKMSANAGADHGAEAPLRERPRRVLARAAAAEVIAGQQDLHALRFRLVEYEIRIRIALRRRSASH